MRAKNCAMRVLVGLFLACVFLGGCASKDPVHNLQVLSGPQASAAFRLPDGTPPFQQMRNFPTFADFCTTTTDLGKSLGLTVVIGQGQVDWSRGVDAVIEQTLTTMRETYENPQIRVVGSAGVLGTSVPILETKDGTGDDELSAAIPVRRGLVSIMLTAQGNEDASQHVPFFKQLLEGALIREK